ncbi:hypothetical protein M3Y94_01245300 [Aphelenchoides besseyi]|nr:hypothetical protein M3Y94_01245300 [Aphelenchoides besseyi]KAI6219366.1 hypothetical protein M3Y95_01103500 [Aphelenchoides besseyi]
MVDYNTLKCSFEEKLKSFRVAENCALSAAEVLISMQQLIVDEKMAIERERAEWNNQRAELEQKHRDLINERNEARRNANEQTTEIQRLRSQVEILETENRTWKKRAEVAERNVLDSTAQIRDLQQKNSELQQNCLVKEDEKKHLLLDIEKLEREKAQREADFTRREAQTSKQNLQELENIKADFKEALKKAEWQVKQLAPYKQECETLRSTNKMLRNQAEGYRRLMRKESKPVHVNNLAGEFLREINGSSSTSSSSSVFSAPKRFRSQSTCNR